MINFAKNFSQYDATLNYFTKKNLHHKMLDMHYKKFLNKTSTLYICASPYPANLEKNKFDFLFVKDEECYEQNFYDKLTNKDLILINSSDTTEILLQKYILVEQVKVQKVGRFGNLVYTNLIFLKKPS